MKTTANITLISALAAFPLFAQIELPWEKPGQPRSEGKPLANPPLAEAPVEKPFDLGAMWVVTHRVNDRTITEYWVLQPNSKTSFYATPKNETGSSLTHPDAKAQSVAPWEVTIKNIKGNTIVLHRHDQLDMDFTGTIAPDGKHVSGKTKWNDTEVSWSAVIKSDSIITGETESDLPVATTNNSEEPPEKFISPDGKIEARIVQKAMPGTDGVTNFFTLEVLVAGKVIKQVPTEGYLMSVHPSPDGKSLAINNRRGNQGDYLWVVSLSDGSLLKRADDPLGARWLGTALAEIEDQTKDASADNLSRSWITAQGWSKSGDLLVSIRVQYRGLGAFDYTAPANLRKGKLVLLPGNIASVK